MGILSFILSSYALEGLLPTFMVLMISILFGLLTSMVVRSIALPNSGRRNSLFENSMIFLREDIDDVVLFLDGSKAIAIGGLELERIPIGVRGNFEFFIRSAYAEKIPLTYVFIQEPLDAADALRLPEIRENFGKILKRRNLLSENDSILSIGGIWKCRVLLFTRSEVKSRNEEDLIRCIETVRERMAKIKSLFLSGFPHTKLRILRGADLQEAVSCIVRGVEG